MCNACDAVALQRRQFLVGGAAAVTALAGMGTTVWAAGGPVTHVKPDEALEKLKAGNARYVAAPQVCAADLAKCQRDQRRRRDHLQVAGVA